MLKSILICLDGSPSDDVAVELAIQWAKRFNAILVGLGIVNQLAPFSGMIGSGEEMLYMRDVSEDLLADARKNIGSILERFAQQCAESGVAFKILENVGLPYEAILQESQRYDLVLFGHEEHFRFGLRNRPDETLWNVLKQEARPVVIAPRKLASSGSSVVVAYNESRSANRALQAFQTSGLDFGKQVFVFSVDEDLKEASRQAETAVEFLCLHQIDAIAHPMVLATSPADAVLEEICRQEARLLVMGAYGHSTVLEFLLGSNTTRILKECPIPVFLCH